MTMKRIKKCIIEYGKNGFLDEQRREDDHIKSIFIILIINIILIFISLWIKSYIIYISLLNLIFIMQTQWFYKKHWLRTAKEFANYINKSYESVTEEYTEECWLDQQISDYDRKVKNRIKINDIKSIFGMISFIITDIDIILLIIDMLMRV